MHRNRFNRNASSFLYIKKKAVYSKGFVPFYLVPGLGILIKKKKKGKKQENVQFTEAATPLTLRENNVSEGFDVIM